MEFILSIGESFIHKDTHTHTHTHTHTQTHVIKKKMSTNVKTCQLEGQVNQTQVENNDNTI